MCGWKGRLTSEQTGEIAAAKRVIYDGFTAAVAAGVPRDKAGILVDEQFGASILRDAEAHGYVTARATGQRGQADFQVEQSEQITLLHQNNPSTLFTTIAKRHTHKESHPNQRSS